MAVDRDLRIGSRQVAGPANILMRGSPPNCTTPLSDVAGGGIFAGAALGALSGALSSRRTLFMS
jgi:hypothetical protein